ncbi:MAG: acyltransferase [Verrucomicrobia bacterium]|nr:acyltransferase [Verrucomicrobiota bacterium]
MEPRKIKPYLSLDLWRAIAAIWVVMFHASCPFIDGGHSEYLANPLWIISMSGSLGVTMFFVISGYCITGAACNLLIGSGHVGRFMYSRIRRIYPPYLFALAACLIIGVVSFILHKDTGRIDNYPLNNPLFWLSIITLTHYELGFKGFISGISWTLCYEVAFYGIVSLILCFAVNRSAGKAPKAIGILSLFLFVMTFVSLSQIIYNPYKTLFPFNEWYKFGLGSILYFVFYCKESSKDNALNASLKTFRIFIYLQAFIIALLCIFMGYRNGFTEGVDGFVSYFIAGRPSVSLQLIVSSLFVLSLWVLRPLDDRIMKYRILHPLLFVGVFSYSLYLTHMLITPFILSSMRRCGFDGALYWITFWAAIILTSLFGWIFYLLIERRFITSAQKKRVRTEMQS